MVTLRVEELPEVGGRGWEGGCVFVCMGMRLCVCAHVCVCVCVCELIAFCNLWYNTIIAHSNPRRTSSACMPDMCVRVCVTMQENIQRMHEYHVPVCMCDDAGEHSAHA